MDFTLFVRSFAQGAALGFSAASTPGSLQTLLISETLLGGFKRGARITLTPLITDAPIISSLQGFDPRGYRDRLDQAPACLNVLDFKDPVRA